MSVEAAPASPSLSFAEDNAGQADRFQFIDTLSVTYLMHPRRGRSKLLWCCALQRGRCRQVMSP